MKLKRRLGCDGRARMFALLLGFVAGIGPVAAEYHSPFWLAIPYDPAHSSVSAEERSQIAVALSDYARAIAGNSAENDMLRMKAIALALRFDPDSKAAVIANAQFKHGNFAPPPGPSISKDDLTNLLQLQIKKMQAQTDGSDKAYTSYILDFLASINPSNDDLVYQAEMAQRQSPVNWGSVTQIKGAAVTAAPPSPATPSVSPTASATTAKPAEGTASSSSGPLKKLQSKVNGLVVLESDGDMLGGKVMEVIVTAAALPPDMASSCEFTKVVGDEMATAKDEALRTIGVLYPDAKNGIKYSIGFDDKYIKVNGGSAGTAFAVGMLSVAENIPLDPTVAMTGDITMDGKVRKVGAVPVKIRGAMRDGCKIVGVPSLNSDDVADLMVMDSFHALADIHIFSLETLSEAVDLARTNRSEKLAKAIDLFTQVQDGLKHGMTLNNPDLVDKLDQITKLAPNDLSARYLLQKSKGTAPTTLTPVSALDELLTAASPVMVFFRSSAQNVTYVSNGAGIPVISLQKEVYTGIRNKLDPMEKQMPSQIQGSYFAMVNLLDALQQFDEEFQGVPHRREMDSYLRMFANDVTRKEKLQDIIKRYDALVAELVKLDFDKEFVQSQIR